MIIEFVSVRLTLIITFCKYMRFRKLATTCHLSLYDSKIYSTLITEFDLILVNGLVVVFICHMIIH